jgi:hypothetical protein
MVLLVLLFFTGPLSHLPNAVLATIVFLIGVKLVDHRGLTEIYRAKPWEFVVGGGPSGAKEARTQSTQQARILRLDRLRLRGPNGARDEFLLAATAQNLRKLAKLIPMPSPHPA